jgi:hypothetical protein
VEKWQLYCKFFYAWVVLHLSSVVLLMTYIVAKSQLLLHAQRSREMEERSMLAFSVLFFVLALAILVWMVYKLVQRGEPLKLKNPHSSGFFLILYFVFNISIVVDCIW